MYIHEFDIVLNTK